jgi:hypothetical protein
MAESREAMTTAEINQLHQEITGAARTSLAKAIRIGELLVQQKAHHIIDAFADLHDQLYFF